MVENQNPELVQVVKHFHPKYLFPKMNFKGWFGEKIWAASSEALYRDLDQCIISPISWQLMIIWLGTEGEKKERTINNQKLSRRKCSSPGKKNNQQLIVINTVNRKVVTQKSQVSHWWFLYEDMLFLIIGQKIDWQ
jgi:hypothetical protein